MSLEIRCTCGWRCQASEYYLGDRIACPECGTKVPVHARSGIPYGYAPYPTWQKRFKMPAPLTRRITMLPASDPHAAPAFWLGLFGIFASLTGCGTVIGLVLAGFGIRQALRSARWNRSRSLPAQPQARLGMAFSVGAILLAGMMFVSLLNHNVRPDPQSRAPRSQSVNPEYRRSQQFIYPDTDAAKREHEARMKRMQAERHAWEQAAKERGYKYPAEPKPPFVRTNDFDADQAEYSRKVQEGRANQGAEGRYRYGK